MSKLVVLDPGHGGKDPGATFGDVLEKVLTLKIALKTRDILLENYEGVDVELTRTKDEYVSLDDRTDYANKRNADYLCSIHVNAGGGQGFETFIYNGSWKTKHITEGHRDDVHQAIVEHTDFLDRGQKEKNLHMVRESNMPAVLTENGFIDNKHDRSLLTQSFFIHQIASGHADGIARAMNLKERETNRTISIDELRKLGYNGISF